MAFMFFSNTRMSNGDLRMLRESGYESWNYQNQGDGMMGQRNYSSNPGLTATDDKYMMEMMDKDGRKTGMSQSMGGGMNTSGITSTSQHGTIIKDITNGSGDAWKDKISKLQEKCAQIPKLVQFKLSQQGQDAYGQPQKSMWGTGQGTNPQQQQQAMVFEDSSDIDWQTMIDKPTGTHSTTQQYDQYGNPTQDPYRDSSYMDSSGQRRARSLDRAGAGYRDGSTGAYDSYAHGDQRGRNPQTTGSMGSQQSYNLPLEKVVYDYRTGVLRAKLKHVIVHHDPGGDVFDIIHPSMGEEYHGHLDIINRLEAIDEYSYHSGEDFANRYHKQIDFMNKIAVEYLADKTAGGKSRSIYHVIE